MAWLQVLPDCLINSNYVNRVSFFRKDNQWHLRFVMPNGMADVYIDYNTKEAGEAAYAEWSALLREKKGRKNMLDGVKKYIEANRDLIYTVAFVAIVDQLLFEGAFRERLKTLVEGFLKKAETAQSSGA